ncbi:hypothetical protein HNW77_08255 [Komagataeibacter sp. AV436]|uniref:Uncharacterized protein n=1 Tax=Komagataeibacter melomenusus TaxID=2766578 RepID=A0ABX2AEW2_9PROT|nr:hypothetical protein [Komagataeibacter melomenusus]MBV1830694.1 hypothetical protein [Komagataeibacter melomenusus]NPC66382.1 hypothetical protein [Komagataeibacter melomenusus]
MGFKRLFENKSLIKIIKVFGCRLFSKRRHFLYLSSTSVAATALILAVFFRMDCFYDFFWKAAYAALGLKAHGPGSGKGGTGWAA